MGFESTFWHEKWDDGRERAAAGATDSVAYFEWSANPDLDDPGSVKVWRRCMPALGRTISEDVVRADFDAMDVDEFRRAYLNLRLDVAGRPVINPDAWAACRRPDAHMTGMVRKGRL